MKKALFIVALSFGVSLPAYAAGDHVSWGYTGQESAKHWGDLSDAFDACKSGVAQSPVNIEKFVQEEGVISSMSYLPSPLEVENNGHSVSVQYQPGSGFHAGDKNYDLLGIHFHTPSEHYIDGAPYPMEAHFVHKSDDGDVAVIAVMLKVGAHNPVIEGIWQNVPSEGDVKEVAAVEITASDLMPEDKSYYRYEGSLTTPPCTEDVQWFVMQEPIELSEEQLRAFQFVFPVNARPIQPLGARVVKGN